MTSLPFSLATAALKPSDIAGRLDVEVSTVYRWMRSGELPSIEVAGTKYVLVPAYERFLERHQQKATIDQQAERYIGAGFEEQHDAALDVLEGLALPIAISGTPGAGTLAVPLEPAIEDARDRLRRQLEAFESRFGVASEHVHRLRIAERQPRVEGVPDELVDQWAAAYAAYLSLSLVGAH